MRSFLHWALHRMKIETARSQTSARERALLGHFAKGRELAAELGVYEGVNTSNIARNLAEHGTVYAIDPFYSGRLGVCWSYHIAKQEVSRSNTRSRVEFIRCLSWEASKLLPDDFDFVFFDGDHSVEGLRRDWEAWSPKIRKGGLVALHDVVATDTTPEHGCQTTFEEVVLQDPRFHPIAQTETLAVLQRK